MVRVQNPHSGQITGAVFLIGIGLLFALGWFWPGILYLLGTTAIVDGTLKGRALSGNFQGGLFLIGLGLVFSLGFGLPLLFIILGLMTLFGIGSSRMSKERHAAWKERYAVWKEKRHDGPWAIQEKAKNDWKYKNSELDQEREEDLEYRLGDDGELIEAHKVKNEQRHSQVGGQQ